VNRHLASLAARAIRATALIDTAYRRFDSLRSSVVARFAPDAVLDAFNDLTYGVTDVYRPDAPNYRSELFNWEQDAIARVFPAAPARVLIGGAGGGREAFALAARGYEVVAFEPSSALVGAMAAHAAEGGVAPFVARYEDLPHLRTLDGANVISLRERPRFDAALLGWASYSHIRHRADRVLALREIAAVTAGPVLVSFYLAPERRVHPTSRLRRVATAIGITGGPDHFTTHVGFYHLSTPSELRSEAADAGLEIVHECYDSSDGRWPYIVVRRAH
jgi:SAM-dependent methyltransferase